MFNFVRNSQCLQGACTSSEWEFALFLSLQPATAVCGHLSFPCFFLFTGVIGSALMPVPVSVISCAPVPPPCLLQSNAFRSFACFLIGSFSFSLLNFKSSLAILIAVMIRYASCKCFLPVRGSSSQPLDGALYFNKVCLASYFFHGSCCGVLSKNCCQIKVI